jgi:dihydrofolate reductase
LDGFVAGPNQSEENPLGERGERLHDWAFSLGAWRESHAKQGGEVNESTWIMEETLENIGAGVMGRNMFGPVSGDHPADITPRENGVAVAIKRKGPGRKDRLPDRRRLAIHMTPQTPRPGQPRSPVFGDVDRFATLRIVGKLGQATASRAALEAAQRQIVKHPLASRCRLGQTFTR